MAAQQSTLGQPLYIGKHARRRVIFVLLSFGAFGLINSVWQSALPDLQNDLHLSSQKLGSVITIGYLLAIPVMSVGGRLVDWMGANRMCAFAVGLMACSLIAITLIHTYVTLVLCGIVYCGATGLLDIGVNAAAIAEERDTQSPLLPSAHGFYSLFAMFSAIAYGLLLYFGASFRKAYILVAIIILTYATVLLIIKPLPESKRDEVRTAGHKVGIKLFLDGAILAVAFIVLLGLMGDATLGNWTAIYLRGISHGSAIASSFAISVYHASMASGRFLVNRLLRVVSRRKTLMWAGIAVAAGMSMGVFAHQIIKAILPAGAVSSQNAELTLIIVSIFVVGVSLAVIMPISISIGGDLRPNQPADVSSVMMMAAYVSNLVSPLMIGSLADRFGLKGAMSTVIVVGVAIAIFGPIVARMATREVSRLGT